MKYYKYYKIVRSRNQFIRASRVIEYIRQLELANNLDEAFNNKGDV